MSSASFADLKLAIPVSWARVGHSPDLSSLKVEVILTELIKFSKSSVVLPNDSLNPVNIFHMGNKDQRTLSLISRRIAKRVHGRILIPRIPRSQLSSPEALPNLA